MPRHLVLSFAGLFLLAGAQADDEAPASVSFETVLSDKGLKRSGVSYILKDTESRDRRLGEFVEARRSLDGEYKPLLLTEEKLVNREKQAKENVKDAEKDVEDAEKDVDRAKDSKGKDDSSSDKELRKQAAERALSRAKDRLQRAKDARQNNLSSLQ